MDSEQREQEREDVRKDELGEAELEQAAGGFELIELLNVKRFVLMDGSVRG